MEAAEGVTFAEKDELLRTADFVLLSTPLTPETERMIGARELDLMKPSAFLVNICRGGVIDEDALVAALQNHRIAGAGLDVFLYEPIPFDHPLLALRERDPDAPHRRRHRRRARPADGRRAGQRAALCPGRRARPPRRLGSCGV